MGNWKELGVVPDSDDEGFDSEDSLPPPVRQRPPRPTTTEERRDIWEFPSSSEALSSQRDITPTSKKRGKSHGLDSTSSASPGTDIQHTLDRQVQDAPNSSPSTQGNVALQAKSGKGSQDALEGKSDVRNASATIPSEQDEISPSVVQIFAPSANPFPGSSLGTDLEPQFSGVFKDVEHSVQPSNQPGNPNSRRDAPLELSPRAGRSLRPRKPIQEHPYLLENAQYSRFMKSHGVKPIHFALQDQNPNKSHDENVSQEQDYAGGESQPTSGTPGEESQHLRKDVFKYAPDDDLDELALSPSPRTSSPRHRPQASSERSRSRSQQTDDTSINGEEFPDIKYLALKPARMPAKLTKRPTPSRSSTSRKRLKSRQEILESAPAANNLNDDWDIPPSPGPLRADPALADSPSPDSSPRSFSNAMGDSFQSTAIDRLSSGAALANRSEVVDLTTALESGQDEDASELEDSSSSSDSDAIQRTGRKIKGVLPASWLRLDQQTSKTVRKGVLRKPPPSRFPDGQQRGVATVRSAKSMAEVGLSGHDHENKFSFLGNEVEGVEDSLSVIEEDHIDWMLPGGKRNRTSRVIPNKRRNNAQQRLFKGEQRYRQPKISDTLGRANRSSNGTVRTRKPRINSKRTAQRTRAVSPPALGIADVIEPDAPRFIRIAARAASRRQDLGRSKPNAKAINLGTRRDNVDAHSILRDWAMGKIKRKAIQRRPPSGLRPTGQDLRKPRWPVGKLFPNVTTYTRPRAGPSDRNPSNSTRHLSLNEHVVIDKAFIAGPRPMCDPIRGAAPARAQSHNPGADYLIRPAQLEDDVLHGAENAAFAARKKMLDLVFHKTRKEILAPTFRLQECALDSPQTKESPEETDGPKHGILGHAQLKGRQRAVTKPRFRKQFMPRRLDLDAPQFRHANDPLLEYNAFERGDRLEEPRQEQDRIVGLGPYGTQYTHHFDIFPLQRHVFFHHSTLIGNGDLKKALDCEFLSHITRPRAGTSFKIAHHSFHWGLWTDTTSSELGLLFEMLSEQLSTIGVIDAEQTRCNAINCADHVLGYVLHSLWVEDESNLKPCAQRLFGLLLGFSTLTESNVSDRKSGTFVETTTRLLICSLVLLRICQGTPELSSISVPVEELMKSLSKAVIQGLLKIGTSGIRATYDDLQRLTTRERGIRGDNFTMTCWVVVIKVLDAAHIPRAGFWDLTYSLVGTPDLLQSSKVQDFESVWETIFTLVPLQDFDDNGISARDLRHTDLVQGSQRWGLPQKLLKRVFESCRNNPKQSPGFNDYCRALLGRCHSLIDQWGWYKCSGIVGTIFDFFGQQNLSNLRHEEVSKSPRFLEQLSTTTELSVEADDRCFHIFLKILALSIQIMRKHGLSNDIRNLIARTLPNHDRQYSKEQAIHAHDLAALRNHHDLLCTLFWAAPAEERPAIHLIEKLISPGSSHKEAVLLHLQAWRQLAAFVVSSGATHDVYRPLMLWQNRVFQQVLDQYHSAASEIQRQFMSMPSETRKDIGQHMVDNVVSANQTAAKDVLRFSVAASLSVMRSCPSLASVMFSFNTSQLSKALTNIGTDGENLECDILGDCFETVELFLERLESFGSALKEESDDSFSSSDNREYTDAVELFDEKVVQGFFIAVRQVLSSPASVVGSYRNSLTSIREKAVILSGRIASVFINGGKRSLKHFFSIGKYGLFENVPQNLSLDKRTYLPLFVAILLKNHIFDFSSVGCSHFDIWVLSLVKPFHALKYEMHLAETLKTLELGYMKGSFVIDGVCPNYRTSRDFFACAVSYMRKELRQSDSARRMPLRAKYEKLLKLVMQQMKSDIKSVGMSSAQHKDYTSFIREIVALIQSHGTGISTVDSFYLQASAEFSPATEDPKLHSAVIVGYGLRLGEGDTTAGPQLFSFLCTHFKRFMADGQLDAESKIIENGMANDNILGFVLGRMLPAVIQASFRNPQVWPLVTVYSQALKNLFGRSHLPREIPDKFTDHSISLLETISGYLLFAKGESTPAKVSNPTQIKLFAQMMEICHALRPSLMCWLLRPSLAQVKRLRGCIHQITLISRQAAACLDEIRDSQDPEVPLRQFSVGQLLAGLADTDMSPCMLSSADSQVSKFAQQLQHDLQDCWAVTEFDHSAEVAQTSPTQLGTQLASVVSNGMESRADEPLSGLHDELKKWIQVMGTDEGDGRGRLARRAGRPGRARMRQSGRSWRCLPYM
ncbi:hypothetical protein KVR01_009653 [Diaporthe batatas]|uniref:uncharacterized protein n=1 Tax=Diaporthe batatas TaxID=748121 RepID=UPI001D04BA65|nr:uncharacterized protein KVR01_009653 [Diaporthe batatas]KAG8160117.1 hypothetical protein KVR01_009653 [Diaporthe batatas]